MTISTAMHVSEAIINLSHEKQSPVSNLKLQKLLYYAQAWFLALQNEALFEDSIEAWVHGPVVPSVFRRYRDCRWHPIPPVPSAPISSVVKNHLEEVWRVYGKFPAARLETLTHSEQPWIDARGNLPIDAPSYNCISIDTIQKYYSSLVQ